VYELRNRKNYYCKYERNNRVDTKRKNKKDMATTKNTPEKATTLFETFKKDLDSEEEYRKKHYRQPSDGELKPILRSLNMIYAHLLNGPQSYQKVTAFNSFNGDNVDIVNLTSKMINPAKLIKSGACGKTKDNLVSWIGEAPNTEMASEFHFKSSYANHIYNSRHQIKKLSLVNIPDEKSLPETPKINDVVSDKENLMQESKTNDSQSDVREEIKLLRQDLNKFKLEVIQILKSAIAE